MFEYSVKQKAYNVCGVKIGGDPGLVPMVMVRSIFYNGHMIIENPTEGLFDEIRADSQLRRAEEMSDATGLPTMVDLVAENAVAAGRYLDFMVKATEVPIFLDVVDEATQVESIQYASDQGMMNRIILNSLNLHSGKRVYEKVKEAGCRNAVLLLYSM